MQEKRRKYSPEFKVEAARSVVESSRPIVERSERAAAYRRVHAALARQGEGCGLGLGRDLMGELGMGGAERRPWRRTTGQAGEGGRAVAALVGRDLRAEAPGTKMVGDIT